MLPPKCKYAPMDEPHRNSEGVDMCYKTFRSVRLNTACRELMLPYVYIISFNPLRTWVYFKRTYSCTYIPWSANVRILTKTRWICGYHVTHFRIGIEEEFYLLVWRPFGAPLAFCSYPKRLWLLAPPVEWISKSSVMNVRRHQNSDEGNKSMGRVGSRLFSPRLFAVWAPHQSYISLPWSKIVSDIAFCVPYLPATHFLLH